MSKSSDLENSWYTTHDIPERHTYTRIDHVSRSMII
jgi:hypothetical protein